MTTLTLSQLLNLLPNPNQPWQLSESLRQRVDQTPLNGGNFKKCRVLSSDPEWNFVHAAFDQQKPTTYKIKKIYHVYRELIAAAFRSHLSLRTSGFRPEWPQRREELLSQRTAVIERWNRFIGRRRDAHEVHHLPLWYGSTKERFEAICELGFKIDEPRIDPGYFGKGCYFATTAKYAVDAYSPDGHALLSIVSMREPYPVLYEDYKDDSPSAAPKHPLLGGSFKDTHDAHYIPVVPEIPGNPFVKRYIPPRGDQAPQCEEFVVFKESQTLPMYWVELLPDLDLSRLSNTPAAKSLFQFVLNVLRQEGDVEHDKRVNLLLRRLELSIQRSTYAGEEKCVRLYNSLKKSKDFFKTVVTPPYTSAYIEYCKKVLIDWKTTFEAQERLIALPTILEHLLLRSNNEPKKNWDEGYTLFFPLLDLGEIQPLSPPMFLREFFEEYPEESLAEFVLKKITTGAYDQEICLAIVKKMAKASFSNELHEKLYKILSESNNSEPLRKHYLEQLPRGALVERLAFIPNRSGFRHQMRMEQENLQRQIEKITQEAPTPVKVSAPFFQNPRYLKREFIRQKLLRSGFLKGAYESQHAVCRIAVDGEFDLHLKEPSFPQVEYAVYNLTSRLVGKGAPCCTLVRFDVQLEDGTTVYYPVLASTTVKGTNLRELLSREESPTFDRKQLTHLQLMGLLIRPADGKASNFVVNESGEICGIDNETIDQDPVVKTLLGSKATFHSILYCFDREQLDKRALDEWSAFRVREILEGWIDDLKNKEEETVRLFTPPEREELLGRDPNKRFLLSLALKQGTITTLYTQMLLLQDLVRRQQSPPDAITLLQHLINLKEGHQIKQVGAVVYRAYEAGYRSYRNPDERLGAALGYRSQNQSSIPSLNPRELATTFSLHQLEGEFKSYSIVVKEDTTTSGHPNSKSVWCKLDGLEVEETQKMVIIGIGQTMATAELKPSTVKLKSTLTLTSLLIAPFISDTLVELDLQKVPITSLPQNLGPSLKKLILRACRRLTSLSLVQPALEIFDGSRSSLTSLQLTTPRLKTCRIRHINLRSAIVLGNFETRVDGTNGTGVDKIASSFLSRLPNLLGVYGTSWDEDFIPYFNASLTRDDEAHRHLGVKLGELAFPAQDRQEQRADIKFPWTQLLGNITNFDQKVKRVADFLQITCTRTINLTQVYLTDEDIELLVAILPGSLVTSLDLTLNAIGRAKLEKLLSILPQTSISELILDDNPLKDEEVNLLASSLPNSQVTLLSLKNTRIVKTGVQKLFEVIPLTKLITLDLRKNSVQFKGELALAALQVVDKIKVDTLDLRGCDLSDDQAIELSQALPHLSATRLELGSNQIGDGGFIALLRQLERTTLKTLSLENNQIGDQGARELIQARFPKTLLEIDLNDNPLISDETIRQALAEARVRKHGVRLVLRQVYDRIDPNALDPDEMAQLEGVIPQPAARIFPRPDLVRRPNIAVPDQPLDRPVGIAVEVGTATSLQEFLNNPNGYTKLDLTRKGPNQEAFRSLADVLPGSTITSLSLEEGLIGDERLMYLASKLPQTQLKNLNLKYNNITPQGILSLAANLPRSLLEEVDLSENRCESRSAEALIRATVGTSIIKLNLAKTRIDSSGAQVLSRHLPRAPIVDLDLGGNPIGEAGGRALLAVLPTSSILYLNLARCGLGSDVVYEFIRQPIRNIRGQPIAISLEGNSTRGVSDTERREIIAKEAREREAEKARRRVERRMDEGRARAIEINFNQEELNLIRLTRFPRDLRENDSLNASELSDLLENTSSRGYPVAERGGRQERAPQELRDSFRSLAQRLEGIARGKVDDIRGRFNQGGHLPPYLIGDIDRLENALSEVERMMGRFNDQARRLEQIALRITLSEDEREMLRQLNIPLNSDPIVDYDHFISLLQSLRGQCWRSDDYTSFYNRLKSIAEGKIAQLAQAARDQNNPHQERTRWSELERKLRRVLE